MSTTIIIPSADRAKNVLTKVSGAILYVPEEQVTDYQRNNPDYQVIGHPKHKNLAAKRQEIYERWRDVFMIDDDIYTIVRTNTEGNNRKDPLSPEHAAELIQATASVSRQAGCYLYGFSPRPTPAHYYPGAPINLSTYINACAFGLHWSEKLYFSDKLTAAESYWINLLNAYQHRKSWCDTRYCFAQKQNSTFTASGGQSKHRTLQTEKADTLHLRAMFGQAVRKKPDNPKAKLSHPYQRSIKFPF